MEIKDWITLAGVIVAILVFSYNVRHNRRQITVNKLEEIIQLLSTLENDYQNFSWCCSISLLTEEEYENNIYKFTDEKKYNEISERLKNNKDFYNNTITRLEVLANAYLKNDKLKFRVLTFNNLMKHLSFALFQSDFRFLIDTYGKEIPKNNDINNLVHYLQKQIIKRMNLGHKNLSLKRRIEYREKHFYNDIEQINLRIR